MYGHFQLDNCPSIIIPVCGQVSFLSISNIWSLCHKVHMFVFDRKGTCLQTGIMIGGHLSNWKCPYICSHPGWVPDKEYVEIDILVCATIPNMNSDESLWKKPSMSTKSQYKLHRNSVLPSYSLTVINSYIVLIL